MKIGHVLIAREQALQPRKMIEMIIETYRKEEIILCNQCHGKGVHPKSRLNANMKGYEIILEPCSGCEGSGRLLIKTIKTTESYKGE
jgi:hypothetical protein